MRATSSRSETSAASRSSVRDAASRSRRSSSRCGPCAACPQHFQAQAERAEEVAQVVREDGDQLLGGGPARLRGGIAPDLLGELGAVGDDARPMRDRFCKARILGGEEVVLERRDHHHAAALAADVERHAELRLDA